MFCSLLLVRNGFPAENECRIPEKREFLAVQGIAARTGRRSMTSTALSEGAHGRRDTRKRKFRNNQRYEWFTSNGFRDSLRTWLWSAPWELDGDTRHRSLRKKLSSVFSQRSAPGTSILNELNRAQHAATYRESRGARRRSPTSTLNDGAPVVRKQLISKVKIRREDLA